MRRLRYIIVFLILGLFLFTSMRMKEPNNETVSSSSSRHDIILATWNIGYFSNGVSARSYIKSADFERKLKEYRSLIYDSIRPDIISLNEYNRVFMGRDNDDNKFVTSSILFGQFEEQIIGPSKGIRKALFSKDKLKNKRVIYFKSHKKIAGDESVRMREGYYIDSDIYLMGKKVKLVCVHLLFSRKVLHVVQQSQIEELLEKYKKNERVIICGDWNTGDYSLLKKAGYTLANDGSYVTFPKSGKPLDNIVVKGLTISDVKVIKTDLSDHYPISCKITLK